MPRFAHRRTALLRSWPSDAPDLMLVTQPQNVEYLTGFTGDSSHLLISRDRTLLVTDGRFVTQLADECPDLEIVVRPVAKTTITFTGETLAKLGVRRVGIEPSHMTLAASETLRETAPTVDWVSFGGHIERLRMVKDADELRAVRDAIGMAERAYAMFRGMIRPTDTERELADAMESCLRRAGASGSAFPTIAAVGARSALPHAPPTFQRLDAGDMLLLDYGAMGERYCCDVTRTFRNPFRSLPTRVESELRKIYTIVSDAQAQAIAAVRPGALAKDVDAAARGHIAAAGYEKNFDHGLGHGFGLQVHEGPDLRSSSAAILQVGMIFTIEPGIYVPGFGGVRIEDDILVTEDGCEVLTRNIPRDV